MSDIIDENVNSSLIERLQAFGLTPVEARIYLYLLHRQPQTVVEISRDLALPRTSVYDNSEKLIARGLLARVMKHKSQRLRALPPTILKTLIDEKKQLVEKLEKDFSSLQHTLVSPIDPSLQTEIKYYHGKQGFRQMMWNTLSAKDEIIRYPEFGRIEVVGDKFYYEWAEQILTSGITERAIVNSRPETLHHFLETEEYKKRSRYQRTHVLPEDTLTVSGDTTIYNTTFAICFWKQGEIVGIEIENAELVKMQRSIFETLWGISQPLRREEFT